MNGAMAFALREQIALRDHRARQFDAALFADPAWDMLLELALARIEHRSVTVTAACLLSRVPPTTALRWIGILVDAGLLVRSPNPDDDRSAFLSLSDEGCRKLAATFATTALARVA